MGLTRFAISAALLCGSALPAQSIDWQRIVNVPKAGRLPTEPLSAGARADLEKAISASNTVWDDCEGEPDWPTKLEVHRVNLGAGHFSLAEAGPGCARGGQGSNGAMWLVRWDGAKPAVLGELDGWFDAALPQSSGGLRDVAVGWHNSSNEYGLALYRYNGKRYRIVDSTTVRCDDDGHCTAAPSQPGRHAAGAVATPTKESAQP